MKDEEILRLMAHIERISDTVSVSFAMKCTQLSVEVERIIRERSELKLAQERYEALRKCNPREYSELWMSTDGTFDERVDHLVEDTEAYGEFDSK